MIDTMEETARWFALAVPEPNEKRAQVQMGVHFEEVCEMLAELTAITPEFQTYVTNAMSSLTRLANLMKTADTVVFNVAPDSRVPMIDAIADQLVTAIGTAHMLGMDAVGALNEVNNSNFSKFDENGDPIFNEHGKIMKGPLYQKPHLAPFC